MEEAHRRSIHMMGLMYISTPRSKASHRPQDGTTTTNNYSKDLQNELMSGYYEKLRVNY